MNCKILEKNFDQSVKQPKLPKCWIFQYDSHLKHTAMKIKELINTKKIQIFFQCPNQLPDLNPIENLWKEFKIWHCPKFEQF